MPQKIRVLTLVISQRGKGISGLKNYAEVTEKNFAKSGVLSSTTVIDSSINPKKWLRILSFAILRQYAYDVVHLHLSVWHVGSAFGKDFSAFLNTMSEIKIPLIITIHDDYNKETFVKCSKHQIAVESKKNKHFFFLRDLFSDFVAERNAIRFFEFFKEKTDFFVVHSAHEFNLSRANIPAAKLAVIPLFIQSSFLGRVKTKKQLGLFGKKIIVVPGFISKRKNQRLVVQSLKFLPKNFCLILAGQPLPYYTGDMKKIRNYLKENKLMSKIRITGKLSDAKYASYIKAADLGVCPFLRFSASGSLSDIIANKVPVLASALPQIDELNSVSRGAIKTFLKMTPETLAKRIIEVTEQDHSSQKKALGKLCDDHSINKVCEKYYLTYKKALELK